MKEFCKLNLMVLLFSFITLLMRPINYHWTVKTPSITSITGLIEYKLQVITRSNTNSSHSTGLHAQEFTPCPCTSYLFTPRITLLTVWDLVGLPIPVMGSQEDAQWGIKKLMAFLHLQEWRIVCLWAGHFWWVLPFHMLCGKRSMPHLHWWVESGTQKCICSCSGRWHHQWRTSSPLSGFYIFHSWDFSWWQSFQLMKKVVIKTVYEVPGQQNKDSVQHHIWHLLK